MQILPQPTRSKKKKRYTVKARKRLTANWRWSKQVLMAIVVCMLLIACSASTSPIQQLNSTPTSTAQPTAVAIASGTLLYKADWSHGNGGWQIAPGWQIEQGQLVTKSDEGVTVAIPYRPSTPNYAVEIRGRIARLLHRDGGYISIFARETAAKDGYQAGVSDLKGTEPRPNGSHAQAQAFIDPQSSMVLGSVTTVDYEPHADWHTYRVEVKDNEVSLFIDGTSESTADSTRTDTLANGPIYLGSAMIELHISAVSIIAL